MPQQQLLARADRASIQRRLPIGAEVTPDGTHFRVWAPSRRQVTVVFEDGGETELASESGGYFAGLIPGVEAGRRYRLRLDRDKDLYPDPASRAQPEGPHGPSEVVDPAKFRWSDSDWKGVSPQGQVVYEMHIGSFTPEGTWRAAAEQLPELAEIGITVLEIMPVNEFAGRFGWGYDGVDLFAPTRLYGAPDDVRRFVDRAHSLGVGVILDVVYNHFGPDGCYVQQFSEDYFSKRHKTDWGRAINFDGDNSGPVREFFLANAAYWIAEFHLDGLRLDATQDINDDSADHILAAIGRVVRAAAPDKDVFLVAENEPQKTKLVRPAEKGGYGLDALWNDDFHHSALVALTGRSEAYYSDHRGAAQEFVSAAKYGYLFQGQRYSWQKARRGSPGLDLGPANFIHFIENHDQVANSARGARLSHLTSPGRLRAMTTWLLLGPQTPMLFQGQEYSATTVFRYFADHKSEIAQMVCDGRKEFLSQFPSLGEAAMGECFAVPHDPATFESSKLDLTERTKNAWAYSLHRDLLRLRREDPLVSGRSRRGFDGAVLTEQAWVLRYFGDNGDDRLIVVNMARDLHFNPTPEPLLAPPEGRLWRTVWSSENPTYGGRGDYPLDTENNWQFPGEAAALLEPYAAREPKRPND